MTNSVPVTKAIPCLLLVMALVACGTRPASSTDPSQIVVLKVENRVVSAADWQRYRSMKMQVEQQQDESQIFDLFVEQQILLFLADRDRVDVTDEEVRQNLAGFASPEDLQNGQMLRSARDDLKAQKWIKANIGARLTVTAEQAQRYYRQNSAQFLQQETVQLREILVKDPVFAEKLYRQLKKQPPEEFFAAARKYSKAPGAANDGELGSFQRGDLPEEFERAVFALRPGEITAPVKSDLGYHLFMLEERVRRHRQRFPEVQEKIFETLLADRERDAVQKYLEEAKKTLKVSVYPENVKLAAPSKES